MPPAAARARRRTPAQRHFASRRPRPAPRRASGEATLARLTAGAGRGRGAEERAAGGARREGGFPQGVGGGAEGGGRRRRRRRGQRRHCWEPLVGHGWTMPAVYQTIPVHAAARASTRAGMHRAGLASRWRCPARAPAASERRFSPPPRQLL
ncbi:unnamed protein product [Prorocentrum cordatum]|uniref:Uncharacterized protein n=1 Tax=Prorocentrum cordatum TaxID=2364126 RepID=A0ABN9UFH7_9DINO|nr:unnamed protein product [Polarella glacialis]